MLSSTSVSLTPAYRALLARSLRQLKTGMMPPTVALQVCTSILSASSTTATSSDELMIASNFTSRVATMYMPLFTPAQAMQILMLSELDGQSSSSSSWWITLSGAALHQPLLAATLRRLQTCRAALTMPCLAKAVRCSFAASVFSSSILAPTNTHADGSDASSASSSSYNKSVVYYQPLVDELTSRLDAMSNGSKLRLACGGASAIQEDAETAQEMAKMLPMATSVLPDKLVASILCFLDDVMPRLPVEVKAQVAEDSRPWWSAVLTEQGGSSKNNKKIKFVSQLDLAIATELRQQQQQQQHSANPAVPEGKQQMKRNTSEQGGGRHARLLSQDDEALRRQLAAAQQALEQGSERRSESLRRRRQLIHSLLALPVRCPADNFLVLRCVVVLSAWSKVKGAELTSEERELLRPVICSPSFAARLSSVSNQAGAVVVLKALSL